MEKNRISFKREDEAGTMIKKNYSVKLNRERRGKMC
jgi:hypothetical protein